MNYRSALLGFGVLAAATSAYAQTQTPIVDAFKQGDRLKNLSTAATGLLRENGALKADETVVVRAYVNNAREQIIDLTRGEGVTKGEQFACIDYGRKYVEALTKFDELMKAPNVKPATAFADSLGKIGSMTIYQSGPARKTLWAPAGQEAAPEVAAQRQDILADWNSTAKDYANGTKTFNEMLTEGVRGYVFEGMIKADPNATISIYKSGADIIARVKTTAGEFNWDYGNAQNYAGFKAKLKEFSAAPVDPADPAAALRKSMKWFGLTFYKAPVDKQLLFSMNTPQGRVNVFVPAGM